MAGVPTLDAGVARFMSRNPACDVGALADKIAKSSMQVGGV